MSVGNKFRSPRFIKATSEQSLVRAMLRLNVKAGKEFKFQDIQKQGKHWFAWFVYDFSEHEAVEELENNSSED